ncbi:hypothetical protein, partial [Streptomyces sp. SM14]|uniref:hypothetical protein n=1 Tax=Streptomyces sp. SM14 TaxID=1736045 RepID=UPI0015E17A2C
RAAEGSRVPEGGAPVLEGVDAEEGLALLASLVDRVTWLDRSAFLLSAFGPGRQQFSPAPQAFSP